MSSGLKNQRGLSLTGLIMACAVVGVIALLFMKVFPIYNEKIKVDKAMTRVESTPEATKMGKKQIALAIVKQLGIDGVDRFDEHSLSKILKMGRNKTTGKKNVALVYEIRNSLFADLDIVMNYNRVIELGAKKTD